MQPNSPRFPEVSRFRLVAAFAFSFLGVNCALRLALQLAFRDALPPSFETAGAFVPGLTNDAAALVFALLPPVTVLLLAGERFFRSRTGRGVCLLLLFAFNAVFIFSAFAEYFFWEEFGARFNFIAVDYLVYTTELTRNAVESYPLAPLLAAVGTLALLLTGAAWRFARTGGTRQPLARKRRAGLLAAYYALAAAVFLLFTPVQPYANRFTNEFAKNGVYEIVSAFRHNRLDFRAFYRTMDDAEAASLAGGMRAARAHRSPVVAAAGDRPNVILIIMESMGSAFYEKHTPNLKKLADRGWRFANMLSTGTRTVRGIEAVMLSIPPTPGNSIVRRPDNGDLYTLGTPFRERGYDRTFIYGGLGYFDNMNAFFAGNGFTTVDRLDFAAASKTFANAWGQCDGDLYTESLLRADKSHAEGKPFMQVLLTTSNHRPFTWPGGIPGLEGRTGRRGAVEYADYAIGQFVDKAREKPWFDNTIFIFVGDHPSSIAGKTRVPPDGYGVVCIMYGPKYIQPRTVDTLCSQVDIAPTLLAALGWDCPATFFGRNIAAMPEEEGRAWISTYQLLGFRDNRNLVVLSPDGRVAVQPVAGAGDAASGDGGADGATRLVRETIASYQYAYDVYVSGGLKEEAVKRAALKRPETGRGHRAVAARGAFARVRAPGRCTVNETAQAGQAD